MLYPVSIGGYINTPPSFLYEKTADLEYKNAYQPGQANLESMILPVNFQEPLSFLMVAIVATQGT